MAHTRNNCITRGSSGKLGEVVFTIDGQMRSRPDTSKRVLSQLQKDQIERFERAKEYARMVIYDEKLNDFYAKKAAGKHGLGAWHLAISDYCNPPVIVGADFPEFKGKAGNEVYIVAYDKYKVTEITVSFASPVGIILEEGTGSEYNSGAKWLYTLKSDIELVMGLSVIIRAKDIPGNITSVTFAWPFECSNEIRFIHPSLQGTAKKREKSRLRIKGEQLP